MGNVGQYAETSRQLLARPDAMSITWLFWCSMDGKTPLAMLELGPEMLMKWLLVGHYGRGNLGDDAMLEGLQSLVGARVDLLVAAGAPLASRSWVPERSWRLLRGLIASDGLALGGGTLIHDHGQSKRFRYRGALKSFLLAAVSRSLGKPVVCVGMGLGPVHRPFTKWLARRVLRWSKFVGLRDHASLELARALCPGCEPVRGADLAFHLEIGKVEPPKHPVRCVGLQILPVAGVLGRGHIPALPEALDAPILLSQLQARNVKRVKIFAFSTKPKEDDRNEAEKWARVFRPSLACQVCVPDSPQRALKEMAECDVLMGMRYHFTLFGFLLQRPQIALAYHPKCIQLVRDLGYADRVFMEPEEWKAIPGRLASLLDRPDGFLATTTRETWRDRCRHALPENWLAES